MPDRRNRPDSNKGGPDKERRIIANRLGNSAERLAAGLLRMKGFRILEQRFKGPGGEVDLIARRGPILLFVEVKARRDMESAAYSISERQKVRIIDGARAYIGKHPEYAELSIRFDAMLVARWRLPRHIKGAWRPEERF
jgi:putative endonuclease